MGQAVGSSSGVSAFVWTVFTETLLAGWCGSSLLGGFSVMRSASVLGHVGVLGGVDEVAGPLVNEADVVHGGCAVAAGGG